MFATSKDTNRPAFNYPIGISLLIISGVLLLPSESRAGALSSGYFSAFSVAQGESIDLYASVPDTSFTLSLYKGYGSAPYNTLMTKILNVPGGEQAIPSNGYNVGAEWKLSTSITIPETWSSGIYRANLRSTNYLANGDSGKDVYFIVKAANPGSDSKILVLDNAPTNVAYNNWGGMSLYLQNGAQANTVSLLRPGQNSAQLAEMEFSYWAQDKGIALEYASMLDLHADPTLLSHYNMAVVVGHNEYWTKEMRDNFDTFVSEGGNAMILSGNTMWWQARVEGDQLVSYKQSAANDPMNAIDPDKVTGNWFADPVNDPENRSIGVSFRNAGYVNYAGWYMAGPGSDNGGYTVSDASSWIYEGTGLQNGDVFGVSSTIVGYETDGALFTLDNGKPVVTGEDGTPSNFSILATAEAKNGYATMGVFQPFEEGGYVFNASTVDWADGLWWARDSTKARGTMDPIVSLITENVVREFNVDRSQPDPSSVPLPSAFWLFGSVLMGFWTFLRFDPKRPPKGQAALL